MAKTKFYAEIPYELKETEEGFHETVTPCPFGILSKYHTGIAKVCSFTCYVCEYNQGNDIKNQIVKCTNPKNLE